jgi:hypothetical protein
MADVQAAWMTFFAVEVGACASLAGLVIVAISINLRRILEFPQLPGRAAEMLIVLVGALLVCSFGLMPGQSLRVFGFEVLTVGILMTLAPIVIQARSIAVMKTQPLTWWLWRHLVALTASVPVAIGGIHLAAGASAGMYWLAAGVLLTLAGTVWNAWVLLVEILR